MFEKEYILNRLRNGESMDDICAEIEDALNEANATYEQEQDHANEKQKIMRDIMDSMNALMQLEGCDPVEFTDDDVAELCDMITEIVELSRNIKSIEEKLPKDKDPNGVKFDEEVLNDFLKLFS